MSPAVEQPTAPEPEPEPEPALTGVPVGGAAREVEGEPVRLPGWLSAVIGALTLRVEETRRLWAGRRRAGTLHDYVDDVLSDPGAAGRRLLPGHLPAALWSDPRLGLLCRTLGLGTVDAQWLALLAAVEVEPRLRRLLGYLDDDPVPAEPTPATAAAVWGWGDGTAPGPGSALCRWRLAAPAADGDWRVSAPWTVEPDVVAYLCGRQDWWRRPGLSMPGAPPDDCCYPELLDEMAGEAATVLAAGTGALVLEAVGVAGSGRRTLLRQLCRRLDRPALLVSAHSDPVRVVRTAALLDAVAIWEVAAEPVPARSNDGTSSDPAGRPNGPGDWPAEPPVDDRPGALTLFARSEPGSGAPAGAGLPAAAKARPVRRSSELPALDRRQRLALWDRLQPGPAAARLEPPPAVADWTLTPAELAAAAAAAPLGAAAVTTVCRRRLGALSGALLSAVPCPYVWDDLVVADDIAASLGRLESQIRLSGDVLDDWGFSRLSPSSRGTAALFAGPSGTGKTMAAQILARSLDLDLYRVDLAQVVNKYIGETEKRLSDVFDQCERSNVMVLFDEADALFGQRTTVRDAHDRYANIEIDYLLQRIEAFDGVAILATNRKGDLDQGFLRRLRVTVDFRTPTPAERLRLWGMALPAQTPSGAPLTSGLDYEWLAANLELTCAEIKVVALNAAFAARAQGERIEATHVVAAARQELAKHGSVLRAEHRHLVAVGAPAATAARNGHAGRTGSVPR